MITKEVATEKLRKMYATDQVVKICFLCGMLIGVMYLLFCSRGADADTVLAGYNRLGEMNPFSWLSSGAFFYFCIALIPIISAFCSGILGSLIFKVYHYVRYRI